MITGMSKSAREIAMEATYEADAPKRAAEAARRNDEARRVAQVKRESVAMEKRARDKLKRLLKIDVSGWKTVESHPGYTVLRDPEDDAYHKLTLTVTTWNSKPRGTMRVLYTPYDRYSFGGAGIDHNLGRYGGPDWHGGPEITDMLSLGRAIQADQEEQARINRSMPDYLP